MSFAHVDKDYWSARPSAAVRRIVTRALFEGRPITTQHRWFNHFVFSYFAIQKRLPILKKVKKPIFIMGTGRSGTTILSTLLSVHPDVGMLNEPKAMWHAIYPYEDISGNYSMDYARYRLTADDVDQPVYEAAHKLFGGYLRTVFASHIVDKNPEIVFRVPFVRAIFPDAKFIFLVREGSNTVHSIGRWSERNGVTVRGETHDWWGVNNRKWRFILNELVLNDPYFADSRDAIQTYTNHFDMAAVEWVVTMREGLKYVQSGDKDVYLLKYESLLANPRTALRDLLQYCELKPDEKTLTHAEGRLKPATNYPDLNLHHNIQLLFEETSKALGY